MSSVPARVVRIRAVVPVAGRLGFAWPVTQPVAVAVWARWLEGIFAELMARRPVITVAVLPRRGRSAGT